MFPTVRPGVTLKVMYLDQEGFKCKFLIHLDKFMVPNQAFPEDLITHLSENLPTLTLWLILFPLDCKLGEDGICVSLLQY